MLLISNKELLQQAPMLVEKAVSLGWMSIKPMSPIPSNWSLAAARSGLTTTEYNLLQRQRRAEKLGLSYNGYLKLLRQRRAEKIRALEKRKKK